MFDGQPLSAWKALLLGVMAAVGIFVFDLTQPLGVAGGAPYATLPLLGLLARQPRVVLALAVVSVVLTAAGMQFSQSGAPLNVVLINRSMSIVLICVTAAIAVRHLKVGELLRESLETQAARDPLTELFNRRHVFAIVEDELQRFRRYGERCALILIDADHFKQVNDEFGHPAGDHTLRCIARLCENAVRDSDVVGRFGGEEFIIVLPHTGTAQAAVVAERIRCDMDSAVIEWQGRTIKVTLSLGVTEVGPDIETIDDMLRAADQALYEAKHAGRNHVAISDTNAMALQSANDESNSTPATVSRLRG